MRRTAAVVAAMLVIAIAIAPVSCAPEKPYTRETFVMGTKAWVTIAGLPDSAAGRAALAAFQEMYRIESVMSNWRDSSEVSLLNRESQGKPYRVSPELFSIVDSALYYSDKTFGAFDVTVRPLVLLWGFEGGVAKRIPSDAEIARARSLVGYRKVVLDPAASTITLPPGTQIDLAGIAKGYTIDRCIAVLRGLGVADAFVNLGGNVFAMGRAPGDTGWPIGIRDPRGGTGTVGTILLHDRAVATSGNYENYIEIDGQRFGHLIDPRTGRPVESVLSATVVAPTGLESDALSTGFFVLGPDRAKQAAASLPGVRALFAVPRDDQMSYIQIGDFAATLTLAGSERLNSQ
jgi:thiamine biosynthesis lipoprotein